MQVDAEEATDPTQTPENEQLPDERPAVEERLDVNPALSLSGGGYRSVLFQLGVLWYLNDAGFLLRLDRVASVSGSSITAAVLGARWRELRFDEAGRATNFADVVVAPLCSFTRETFDITAILTSALRIEAAGDRMIKTFRRLLFADTTLQDLPDRPRFIFNATNMQTGSLVRFSKPYIADWRLGSIRNPRTLLALAVAASSAYPPVLSPVHLRLQPGDFEDRGAQLDNPLFTTDVVLTDGGVYDGLAIETVWKRYRTIFVSDAAGRFLPEPRPHEDWARQSLRVLSIVDNQVRALRKRQIVGAFQAGIRTGAYWGTWTRPSEYPASGSLPLSDDAAHDLAAMPTRYAAVSVTQQNRLINFGYAMAARAIRSYYDPTAHAPTAFPRPDGL